MNELMETLNNYFSWLASGVFVLSWVCEFSKIKINPWSWLFKTVSKKINNGTNERLDKIETTLSNLSETIDENEMTRLRYEILSFANTCKTGGKHSKDEFHHIIEINDKYHRIIQKRGYVNGLIDAEMDFILDTYRKCRDIDDFI